MEARPLLHFNLLVKWCHLCILSLTFFSEYCGAFRKEPFRCGGGCPFFHPFGSRISGFGDPLLQLHCDNNNSSNMPLLDIDGNQYYIVEYSPSFPPQDMVLMTIIDKKLIGIDCDPSWTNCTTRFRSSDQLHIVDGNKSIPLWEGCQDDTFNLYFLNKTAQFGCTAWFSYNTSSDTSSTEKCKSRAQNRKDLEPITKIGLEIKWMPSSSCKQCMSHKGWCHYEANITSNPFSCERREHAAKSNKAVILGCSVGGAVVVAICASAFLIYYVKRRKAQTIQSICGINNYHQTTDMEAAVGNLPIFTYKELKQATNCFHENKKLGDGGFGTVYLGNLKDGRTVAVKRLYQQNSRRMQQFINEVKILSSLHHPNLVRLYGCTYPESPVLLLVYEFVPNGTLADHLHGSRRTPKGLAWDLRLNIAIETAEALSFLHSVSPPIFHRDVKSTNILLDQYFRTKVADFGLSRLVPMDVSHVTTAPQGTPGYVDPEYHECFQLTEKSDVYSFGVVLVELISAKLAVDITRSRNEVTLANMAIEKMRAGTLHEMVDPDLETETNHEVKAMVSAVADLAFGCLARDRDFRPDMKEVAERLQEIRLLYERSGNEQLNSMNKAYSSKMPVSPTSVQEEWFSMASENSV